MAGNIFIQTRLNAIVQCLADDQQLAERYRDHALIGNWYVH